MHEHESRMHAICLCTAKPGKEKLLPARLACIVQSLFPTCFKIQKERCSA